MSEEAEYHPLPGMSSDHSDVDYSCPDDTVTVALPASQPASVHRGGRMLSSCEAPQVADLFAANAELKRVQLPPALLS